jgi:hypothetical protein
MTLALLFSAFFWLALFGSGPWTALAFTILAPVSFAAGRYLHELRLIGHEADHHG